MHMCCRDPGKAEELQQVLTAASQPAALPLDVTKDESVASLASSLKVS
jgi:hypothetical protein